MERKIWWLIIGLVAVLIALIYYAASRRAVLHTTPATVQPIGARSKTAGCQVQGALPDPACTPGAAQADVTTAQMCHSGYAKSVRNVPAEEKRAVYNEYGIVSHSSGQYEVDHLISLELGGSNDIANLWPEAANPRPGFHEKDMVENYLHDQVCSGAMTLAQAQSQIAHDWLSVYQAKLAHGEAPSALPAIP